MRLATCKLEDFATRTRPDFAGDSGDQLGRRPLEHQGQPTDQSERNRDQAAGNVERIAELNGYIRADGLMVHSMYVMRVKTPAESKYPWDYYKVIKVMSGEEADGAQPDPSCALVKK